MKIAARVAILLLLAGYAAMLITHLSWAAGGSDSSGYLNEARMMRRGQAARPVAMLSRLHIGSSWIDAFVPLGFVPWFNDGRYIVPTYPAGLPVHFAIAGSIAGFNRGPFLVPPLAAIVSLLLMFILGRQLGLTERESVAGAAILGATAVFIYFAAQPMSDGVATTWTLATMVLALASPSPGPAAPARPLPAGEVFCDVPLPREEVAAKRRVRGGFAAAAGLAFAISVCVRPTNLLMAIPLAVALRFRIRALRIAAAAALPIAVALMLWNHTLYGSYFSTGYGSIRDLVAWSYPRQRLPHYAFWLAAQMTPLVFPGGLFAAFDRRVDRWHRALLVAWFFPLFVFYCFYSAYDSWWYTRFLLPAIPPLIIGFLLLVRRVRVWPIALAIVLAVAVWQDRQLKPLKVGEEESIYPDTMHWVAPLLPRNAIVIASQLSGTFVYYQDRDTVRYDIIDDNRFQELRAYAGAANLRWYAVLMQFELEQFHFRGKWTAVAKNRDVTLLRLDD